jgi:alpha-tubulin suppressor-like RCC1 family protein
VTSRLVAGLGGTASFIASSAVGSAGFAILSSAANQGVLLSWGAGFDIGLPNPSQNLPHPVPTRQPGSALYKSVSIFAQTACAVTTAGGVRCWGSNNAAQAGVPATGLFAPVDPSDVAISNVAAVSAGDGFSCALIGDSQIMCWGANDRGQLGNATAGGPTPSAVVW